MKIRQMSRFFGAMTLALFVVLAPAAAATYTQPVTVGSAAFVDLGAGPLDVGLATVQGVYLIVSDTQPAATAQGQPLFGVSTKQPFCQTSHVWAIAPAGSTATLSVTPTVCGGSTAGAALDGTDASGVTAPTGGVGIRGWLSGIYSELAGLLTVSDNQSKPFQGVVAMTVGTTYTAQRSVGALCTASGNMAMTLADASTIALPVYVGWQTFPFAATTINSSGTTATCSYSNLK